MTSPTPDATHPVAPPRHRHLPWIASAAITFVVALALVLLLLRMAYHQSGEHGPRQASQSALTVSWQTYRDPAGLFTVRIPANWTATRDSGVGVVGDRTGHASQTDYYIVLGDPPHGTTTITFYVYEWPIDSAFLHHWECAAWPAQPAYNSTVDGVPSWADEQRGTVLFDTAAAHYQLDWTLPGFQGSNPLMTASPTPILQADLQADQQLAARILASFTPTPATPLVC